ncbi:hypothetical protein R6Z07M_016466 [Ovis aries]
MRNTVWAQETRRQEDLCLLLAPVPLVACVRQGPPSCTSSTRRPEAGTLPKPSRSVGSPRAKWTERSTGKGPVADQQPLGLQSASHKVRCAAPPSPGASVSPYSPHSLLDEALQASSLAVRSSLLTVSHPPGSNRGRGVFPGAGVAPSLDTGWTVSCLSPCGCQSRPLALRPSPTPSPPDTITPLTPSPPDTITPDTITPPHHHPPTPSPPDTITPPHHHPPTPSPPDTITPRHHHPPTPSPPHTITPRHHHPPTPSPPHTITPRHHHPPTPSPPDTITPRHHHPPTPSPPHTITPRHHHPPTPSPPHTISPPTPSPPPRHHHLPTPSLPLTQLPPCPQARLAYCLA